MDNRKRPKSFVLLASEAATLQRVVGYIKHGTPAFVQTNLTLSTAGFATFALIALTAARLSVAIALPGF
jgi:hypothetical protein